MTLNEYQELAQRTSNNNTRIEKLQNGLMGMCGEAGESIDILKKFMFHGHKLDREHLAKELGDVLWYVAEATIGLGYTLDEIGSMNIEKLKKRYPDGFNTERSINREEGDI